MTFPCWAAGAFAFALSSAAAAQATNFLHPPAAPCLCNCAATSATYDLAARASPEPDRAQVSGETLWDLRANAGLGPGSHAFGLNAGVSWETWIGDTWAWGLEFLAAADVGIFDGGGSIIGIGPKFALRSQSVGPHVYLSLGTVVGASEKQTPTSTCNLFDSTQSCTTSSSSVGAAAELTIAFIIPVGKVQFGPALRAIGGTNVAIATAGLELGFGARR